MAINRTQIARAIFSAAESMGISDRQRIEDIAEKVIERMEQRTLPGMEDLIVAPVDKNSKDRPRSKTKYVPGVAEIQSLVQEILGQEDHVKPQELKNEEPPKMTTMAKPKTDSVFTDNALQVLEKRYLKKDK